MSNISVHTSGQNGNGAGYSYGSLNSDKRGRFSNLKNTSIFNNMSIGNKISANIKAIGTLNGRPDLLPVLPPEKPDKIIKNNIVLNCIDSTCSSLLSSIAVNSNKSGGNGKGSGQHNEDKHSDGREEETLKETGKTIKLPDVFNIGDFVALVKKFESSKFDDLSFVES